MNRSSVIRGSLTIKVGATNLYEGGQVIKAKDVIIHEDYSAKSSDSDIALVRVSNVYPYVRCNVVCNINFKEE